MNDANQPPPAPDDNLWKTSRVAQYLQVSHKTVFVLRGNGLPYVKIGGAVRFDPNEVKEYLINSRRLSLHQLRQIARKKRRPS
jgi:excisionase family DNA binding protein